MSSTDGLEDPACQPRLFVDVTTSLGLGQEAPPAISRIEGEVARRLLRSRDPHVIPVVFSDGAMFALPADILRQLSPPRPAGGRAQAHFCGVAGPLQQAGADGGGDARGAPRPALAGLGSRLRWAARATLVRLPDPIREDARLAMIHAREVARTLLRRRGRRADTGQKCVPVAPAATRKGPALRAVVHPQPGDMLFTAGLPGIVPFRTLAELRRTTGLRVGWACHDVPYPGAAGAEPEAMAAASPTADTVAMLDASERIWAVSTWTAQSLRALAAAHGRGQPRVEVIRLGSGPGMAAHAVPGADSASRLPPQLAGRRFALAVGMVEARSNLGLLLRCWQHLLAADPGFPLDLVIVGRPGHDAADSIREIRHSPLLNARIFWLDEWPDALLAELYAACHLVVHPALADGWALPVSVALAHGRAVIAADAGGNPEAAQGAATLLDPHDDAAWTAALRDAASRLRRGVPPPPQPAAWDGIAARVLASFEDAALPADGKAG